MTDPTDDAVIVDRGYRHFDGTRKGRGGAVTAVIRDGLRRSLGLRRKARSKILPWTLIVLALGSVAVLSALHYAANRLEVTELVADELPRYRDYFNFISTIGLLFVAFATPGLLIPDREQGVLAVYFSRPLRAADYLLAKLAALAILVLGFYIVPQAIFHILLGLFSPDGFTAYMADNLAVLWQVPAAAAVYFVGHASVAAMISTMIPRVGFAAGIYLGVMIVLEPLVAFVSSTATFAGARYVALFAFESNPHVVRDWIFDTPISGFPLAEAGLEPWTALAAVGVTAVAAIGLALFRYRRIS